MALQTVNYDQNLNDKLKEFLEKNELTQTALAKRLNVSNTQINQYLKGIYSGDVKGLEEKVSNFLKTQESIKVYDGVKLHYVETSVASRIKNIAQMCQFNGEIGICYGSSGLGKTTAIDNFSNNRVDVITVDPDENATPRSVLKQIAVPLKAPFCDNTILEDMVSNVVDKLKNRGYLIIIDEAENLKPEVIRTLRKVHDRCNFTFGLLFVGTESLYAQLRRMKGEFAYITNRIARVEALDAINSNDIRLMVNQVFPDSNEQCMNAFIALTNNNARILFNTLKRTKDIVRSSKEPLNAQMIASARGMLLA